VAGGAGRYAPLGVHSGLEVVPASLSRADLAVRDLARPLAEPEHVEQHQEPARAAIENALELTSVVAPQVTWLTFDL
jgi:hypothetical protein